MYVSVCLSICIYRHIPIHKPIHTPIHIHMHVYILTSLIETGATALVDVGHTFRSHTLVAQGLIH
jgi:hypothetical protein